MQQLNDDAAQSGEPAEPDDAAASIYVRLSQAADRQRRRLAGHPHRRVAPIVFVIVNAPPV